MKNKGTLRTLSLIFKDLKQVVKIITKKGKAGVKLIYKSK